MLLIRSKLQAERKHLRKKLKIFKFLKRAGIHPEIMTQLVQEIKNRMPGV